ncbi:hypothetical protein JTB14_034128 [Gonioctena quinquepunctata]|nr:hypothetical protein JTB14_034128 [Gonioctena quinquepunctata]
MVHGIRYDTRISAIRRVVTREEVPYRREERGEPMKNRSVARANHRNERRGSRNLQRGPRDYGANRFPYMRTRCLRCGEGGHQAWKGRRTLFFKLPAPERPAQQLRSSNLPQHVVICHFNLRHSKFIDPFITRTATTWLLDTGASVSLVKKNLVKDLIMPIHRGSTSIITDISGNLLSKKGSVEVSFQLPRGSIEHECIVCDYGLSFLSDGLLGVDFLNKEANVEWYSGFTEVNIINNFGKSDVSKLCIGTADSTPQVNVGMIDTLGIEENGPVESHTLASGLVCTPTEDMRIDLSLSNCSGEFKIAFISNHSSKERTDNRTPRIATADDKGRRNAVPSAGKDNN